MRELFGEREHFDEAVVGQAQTYCALKGGVRCLDLVILALQ
jgi:hypothetical protein